MKRIWILGFRGFPNSKIRLIMEFPAYIIKAYQWGVAYSHVAIVDGRCKEFKIWESAIHGVVHVSPDLTRAIDGFYIDVLEDTATKMYNWLDSQVGKSYDFLGLLGFLWRTNKYQNSDKWFCSELIAAAFKEGGVRIFNWNILQPHQVTPATLLTGLTGPFSIEEVEKCRF